MRDPVAIPPFFRQNDALHPLHPLISPNAPPSSSCLPSAFPYLEPTLQLKLQRLAVRRRARSHSHHPARGHV